MPDETSPITRPTKKQRELLEFIAEFINEHGYSPSYREIMTGLNYSSVATVSLHVNSLIKRGHLRKRDYSARSLEITTIEPIQKPISTNYIKISDEKWLVQNIEKRFEECENQATPKESDIDALYVLVGALRVLGIEGAAQSFTPRLVAIKNKINSKS